MSTKSSDHADQTIQPRRVSFSPDDNHTSTLPPYPNPNPTAQITASPPSSPSLPPPQKSTTTSTLPPIVPHSTKPPTISSTHEDPIRRRTNRTVTVDTAHSTQPVPRRMTSDSSRRGSTYNHDPNMGVLRRMTTGLFTPEKKVGKAPTYWGSFKAAVTSTWLNVLLVFIPIGWALYLAKHKGGASGISDTVVFIITFIAIIPLAGLLGFATEEAAMRLGQTIGGLLNATLGNAVELIVAILALIKCELAVVQSSLVGSILSNILLVLGMCFFAGGVKYAEQSIKSTAAQLNSSLLLIAVIAVLIPSAFNNSIVISSDGNGISLTSAEQAKDLLAMSHGVAILLLVLYLGYLLFQMWTHAHFYVDDPSTSSQYPAGITNQVQHVGEKIHMPHRKKKNDEEEGVSTDSPTSSTLGTGNGANHTSNGNNPNGAGLAGGEIMTSNGTTEDEEEEETPQMNVVMTIGLMVLITILVGVTAEFLVDSINGMVESNPSLSKEWVGLILLPIVGNAAEHFTAVSVSVKDKLDLSISVAVGSSIQIALFVIPVIELLAWAIGKPLTLLFDPYESIVLFLSVLIVNQTLSDGRSNWMEGLVLMFLYLIIAVSFWYYPGSGTATLLGC